jgi:hypothetical protein
LRSEKAITVMEILLQRNQNQVLLHISRSIQWLY